MKYLLYTIFFLIIVSIIAVLVLLGGGENKGGGFTPSPSVKANCLPSENINELISCDPNNDLCSSQICNNELTKCYSISKADPYKVQMNDKTYDVPAGNWCLQLKAKKDQCNPFTSTPILAKDDKGDLKWICDCKYPNLFTKVSVDGDCNKQVACQYVSYSGILQDETEVGQLVSIEDKKAYDFSYDPTNTLCMCKPGYRYNNLDNGKIKTCVADTCSPGTFDINSSEEKCICPEKVVKADNTYYSYVRCPQDVSKEQLKVNCENKPRCLQDPCNPFGYYDSSKKECICNEGYFSTNTDNDIGKSCKSKTP